MGARVAHVAVLQRAGEEALDEVDGLEHAVDPRWGLGPVLGDDVLVEGLAGADPQPVPAREQRGRRRRGLGHHRGMPPEAGGRHPGAQVSRRVLADRCEDAPDEGGLPLLRGPRLEVVGGHDAGEAVALRVDGQIDRVPGWQVLESQRETDRRHGDPLVVRRGAARRGHPGETPVVRIPRRHP